GTQVQVEDDVVACSGRVLGWRGALERERLYGQPRVERQVEWVSQGRERALAARQHLVFGLRRQAARCAVAGQAVFSDEVQVGEQQQCAAGNLGQRASGYVEGDVLALGVAAALQQDLFE